MSLASILRSLGGAFYDEQPIFRQAPSRRLDFEMPNISDPTAPDYDPGTFENSVEIPGEMEQVGTKRTAKPWVQRLQATAPNMVRAGIIAASNPTPGKVGTAADILGGLNAVMQDNDQRDMLHWSRGRQMQLDAQNAQLTEARINEQQARAQMEQARAQDYLKGRGKIPQNVEEEITQLEKVLGRPLTEREKQTHLKLYGPQYDPRTMDQTLTRMGYTPEEILEYNRKQQEQNKPPGTPQAVLARDIEERRKQAITERQKAIETGDLEKQLFYEDMLEKIRKAELPGFISRPRIEKTEQGIVSISGNEATPITVKGDMEKKPLFPPKKESPAPRPQRPFAQRPITVIGTDGYPVVGAFDPNTGATKPGNQKVPPKAPLQKQQSALEKLAEEALRKRQTGGSASLPPEAAAKLKEGVITKFGNGQEWTLRGGTPARVN